MEKSSNLESLSGLESHRTDLEKINSFINIKCNDEWYISNGKTDKEVGNTNLDNYESYRPVYDPKELSLK